MSETLTPGVENLRELLTIEKYSYLKECQLFGGTAQGFRERIRKKYAENEKSFNRFMLDAVMEATTRKWQAPPRTLGPDLFSIGGEEIPEHLTRPTALFVSGDDIAGADENRFEKVDSEFATVNDLLDDATIKLRKAAQSSAKAEKRMRTADEARRRAKGNMSKLLREIADVPAPPSEDMPDHRPHA